MPPIKECKCRSGSVLSRTPTFSRLFGWRGLRTGFEMGFQGCLCICGPSGRVGLGEVGRWGLGMLWGWGGGRRAEV